jgi:transposase
VIQEEAQFRATSGEEPVMKEKVRFLGLDVHAETIAVAIAEPDGEVRSLGTIANRAESIRKLIKKLGSGRAVEGLLRGRPDGLRSLLAVGELGVRAR